VDDLNDQVSRLTDLDIDVERQEYTIKVEMYIRNDLVKDLANLMEVNDKLESS